MNSITFSCADFAFPLLTHNKALQLIKLLDFEAVDLGVFEDRSPIYPSQIARDPVGEGKRLQAELQQLGLTAADVFLQTGAEPPIAAVNDPDANIRAHNRDLFRKIIDFSNTLHCDHITGLPGVLHAGEPAERDWDIACEETRWRVATAKASQITYAVEAHVGSILPDAETTMTFLNDCPGLSLTLDYGHFIYQGQTTESVHPLLPFASHFHARGGAHGKLQTIVKENTIDYAHIVAAFKKTGYKGAVCMEYTYQDWEGCNRTDNVSETLLLRDQLHQLFKGG